MADIKVVEVRIWDQSVGAVSVSTGRGNEKVHVQSLCGLMLLDFNTSYMHAHSVHSRVPRSTAPVGHAVVVAVDMMPPCVFTGALVNR